MLEILAAVEAALPDLLAYPDDWDTLDIDYEAPRVERLSCEWEGGCMIHLHRIHPCNAPPRQHHHAWPSAIRVLAGAYDMTIGYSMRDAHEGRAMRLRANDGGIAYEMIERGAWHSVRPVGPDPTWSIMVIGPEWADFVQDHTGERTFGHVIAELAARSRPKRLIRETRDEMLARFRAFYPPTERSNVP